MEHENRARALSAKVLNRTMTLSYASGMAFVVWFLICSPQPLFNVFIRNYLEVSSFELGLLIGTISFLSVFQLAGIPIFRRLETPKWFWLVCHLLHRTNAFVMAGVSLYIAQGGNKKTGYYIIFAAMVVSWILTNVSSSGWWDWMADIIPEKIRSRFFAKRSSISNIVNIIWFFAVSLTIDLVGAPHLFYAFTVIFLIAGVCGFLDILVHLPMPEMRKARAHTSPSFAALLEPLHNRNFLKFGFAVGLSLFSINIFSPFVAPYIVGRDGIGASTTWLSVQFIVEKLTWVLLIPLWGLVMDKFGKKPVVVLGVFTTASWIGYFFITKENYAVLLPLISLAGALFAPAFWEGINQMMLALSPEKNRVSYVSWYWLIFGVATAFGSYTGGFLNDILAGVRIAAPGFSAFGGFQITLSISLFMVAISMLVLLRIREVNVKPVSYVVSQIVNPGFIRTYVTMGVVKGNPNPDKIADALRAIDGSRSDLAIDEIEERLSDPDQEVRYEAALALGRIGSLASVAHLINILRDRGSSLRPAAARALGKIGDPTSLPHLIEGLNSDSEDLQEACAYAIGEIGSESAAPDLLRVMRDMRSERVRASGASAAALIGMIEAAWEIVPLMIQTSNSVLRTQLAIAFGNIMGRPGEFYAYITGHRQGEHCEKLLQSLSKFAAAAGTQIYHHLILSSEEFLKGNLNDALAALDAHSKIRARHITGRKSGNPNLKKLLERNTKEGIWYWFIQQVNCAAAGLREDELRLYLLLAYYYLVSEGVAVSAGHRLAKS